MTIELTHEQACALRNIVTPAWGYVVESDAALNGLWTVCFVISSQECVRILTDAGQKALAEYNRQYRIVSTKDLYLALETFDNPTNHIDSQSLAAKQDARIMAVARLRATLEKK